MDLVNQPVDAEGDRIDLGSFLHIDLLTQVFEEVF
jgi:hypothetical protein